MTTLTKTWDELLEENERLRQRLEEAEATVEAIRGGEVDAVVVCGAPGEQVYTLEGADHPYRLLVEAMRQGVATLNPEGMILYCNPVFADLLETPQEKVLGAEAGKFLTDADRPVWADMLARAASAPAQCEVQLRRGDDSRFPAALRLSPLPFRQALCLLVTDLTQQKQYEALKRAEEALRQSEAQFRHLADAMPQIVWAARPDGHIDYYNERWYEYTGFPRGQYGQRSWEPILHPDDVQRCVDTYFGCIKAERLYQIEYRFKDRRSGGYRWFLGRAMPVRNEQGQVVRWFGTCTDIDDTKQAQEGLRDADRHKDEFLAMLAHELRNPLAPIRNALHVIQMRGRERREAVRQAWGMIERQVENLVRLVDDLLDVSRISQGKINLQKQPVNVATLVARAVECSRPLIEARRHELEVTLPDQPMSVQADVTRMAQVVMNLLNNAAKYTPEGGRIWLSACEAQGEVAVRVRDTGMGIPANIVPKLFDLFTQAERTLDRAEGGLGIGLTLVRQLTELHDGIVEAFSEGPGQGSEFVVRLPLLREPQPALTPTKDDGNQAIASAPRKRILVVDDNRDSAESLAMLLRLVGQDVRTVHDGRQALVLAEVYRPDLVLLDIGLPGMNGYEVARRLRSEPWLGTTTLVALTGYGGEEDRRQAQAAGFDQHMVKPVDLDALHKLLAALEPRTG